MRRSAWVAVIVVLGLGVGALAQRADTSRQVEWLYWGADPGGTKYTALEGMTDVVETAEAFRMDRFDEHGTPPSVDPVALPFPVHVDDA